MSKRHVSARVKVNLKLEWPGSQARTPDVEGVAGVKFPCNLPAICDWLQSAKDARSAYICQWVLGLLGQGSRLCES